MRKSSIASLAIVLLSFIVGIYLYPIMPDRMASHWNIRGEVDGYISKFWGLFLLPITSLALFLLFIIIPKIDPLKKNIVKFRKYFDGLIILIMLFLFYIYTLTILWTLDFRFNMIQLMIPAFGSLFYYCGILTENSKRNWFIGIRTPWTLTNDKIWNKTNNLGGKLFKITGIISFLGLIIEDYAIFFVLAPAILSVAYVYVYSYLEFRKRRISPSTMKGT